MSARQARFQIVDIVATMKPLTKIVAPDRQRRPASRRVVRDAFRFAMEERPGPGASGTARRHRRRGSCADDVPLVPPHPIEIPVAHPAALDRAADMILQAERPLVMFGAAASRPRATAGLDGVRPAHRHSVLQHADGQGHGRRRASEPVHGNGGALRARLRARGDRPGRPDHRDRPRHGREAAVHHGAERAAR